MGTLRNVFVSAYFAAWMAAVVYLPLFFLHGYRHWWLIALYALLVVTAAAGSISHYRTERRNRNGLRRQAVAAAPGMVRIPLWGTHRSPAVTSHP